MYLYSVLIHIVHDTDMYRCNSINMCMDLIYTYIYIYTSGTRAQDHTQCIKNIYVLFCIRICICIYILPIAYCLIVYIIFPIWYLLWYTLSCLLQASLPPRGVPSLPCKFLSGSSEVLPSLSAASSLALSCRDRPRCCRASQQLLLCNLFSGSSGVLPSL